MKYEKWVDPVTDDHLRAIGRVVVQWSRTERVIMDSLWEIATGHSFEKSGSDAIISLALVTGLEPRTSLGILKAVFHSRHPNKSENLNALVDALAKLLRKRNIVAHGRWTKGNRPHTIECASFISSGELRVEIHAYTPEELNELAERISRKTFEFGEFLQANGYWRPSPPLDETGGPTPAPPHRQAKNNRGKNSLAPSGDKSPPDQPPNDLPPERGGLGGKWDGGAPVMAHRLRRPVPHRE